MSSHVFNAKSCPLDFLGTSAKPSDQARHIHARRRRKEKQRFTNLHSPPRRILILQCPIHKFSKPKGIPFHTKQMPSFRMSSLFRLIVRVSPFRYRSSLGSSTEREITASASFFRKASASGRAGSNRFFFRSPR